MAIIQIPGPLLAKLLKSGSLEKEFKHRDQMECFSGKNAQLTPMVFCCLLGM